METKNIAVGIVIVVIFISVIILFCVLLVKLYIKKIKAYTQQLFQKDINFQKTLTTTVIETQEQVLNNISRDLHDDAGQQLTVINFQLEHLKLDSPEYEEALAPLSESLGKLSESIRSISHTLNNQLVVKQDLLKAIATELERLRKNTRIVVDFALPTQFKRTFTANEKIIIYRIFQECLNNCFKHSKATKIEVTVTATPQFEMIISDNGIGFDTKKQADKTSLGLLSMSSRAASIDYQLNLVSTPEKGTTVTLIENKTP